MLLDGDESGFVRILYDLKVLMAPEFLLYENTDFLLMLYVDISASWYC